MIEHISNEKLKEMYRTMVRIRFFEEECATQFKAGKIPGLVHLCLGLEAISVGVCANLRSDDYVVNTHRGHGHLIARGGEMRYMFSEMFGKKLGYNKGKGGDMHITSYKLGIVATTAIVGAGIPIALGSALSSKMKGTDAVTACFFGDGASNQGTFHESLNLASIWDLPVIFVVENSQFAISTPKKYHQKIDQISKRAVGYDIPGVTVDGNDVLQVFEAAKDAIERARKGGGPTLMECASYNFHQAKQYGNEIIGWEKIFGDPIDRFEKKLLDNCVLSLSQVEDIKLNIRKETEDALAFAEKAPGPETSELLKDVFTNE